MAKKAGIKLIANNKKAFHDYFIEDTYETGIALAGTEVKSLRAGRCSIKEAFVRVENGEVYVIDWSHVTQGNASADSARTFLLFSMNGKRELAEKYINLFSEKSGIAKANIQRWIPIVAATQMTKGKEEEQEFLSKWINVVDYE